MKLTTSIFSLLLSATTFGQSNHEKVLAVSIDGNNFVYRGKDNPITIAVSGITPEKIFVKTDNGTISGSDGKYKVYPGDKNELRITVYEIRNKDTVLVGQNAFRVKQFPDPTIYVAGVTGTAFLQKGELVSAGGLVAKLNNFDFDLKVDIKSFELRTLKLKENDILKSVDNRFTKEMVAEFKECEKGDVFIFQNITVKYPDGSERLLSDKIIITVKMGN